MRDGAAGFTLIELMVGITIAAILLALGAPAMSNYLQRAKLGAVTQSLQSSLQGARTEAIRRNQRVDFITINVAPSSAVANSPTPAGAGQNWLVRAPDPASSGNFTLLDARAAGEGNGSPGAPSIVLQPDGAFTGMISFDGFGRTVGSVGHQINVVHTASGCAASSPVACQAVYVSPGGKVATCSPTVVAGDSRACSL